MKKLIKYLPLCAVIALAACKNEDDTVYDEQQESAIKEYDYDEFSTEVENLEKRILAQEVPSESLLKAAITKFQDFAGLWPDDPKSPDYLFKASDFAMAVNQPEKSVKILDRIINNYPDYNKMDDVLYVKADHLDWELRDTTRAKEAYQAYIDRYPESPRAEDAALRIEYIHLSFEEYALKIINEFEAQNN